MLYVFASHGRHSRSPLKVTSPGRHSMLKRSLARNIFALHARKQSLKHSPGIPLMLFVVASQGRHSRSPLKVATQGRHSRLPQYVQTVTSYKKVSILC